MLISGKIFKDVSKLFGYFWEVNRWKLYIGLLNNRIHGQWVEFEYMKFKSSRWKCSIKMTSIKILQNSQENRDNETVVFLWILPNF